MPTAVPARSHPGATDRLHATCPGCGADHGIVERAIRDHMGPESFSVARLRGTPRGRRAARVLPPTGLVAGGLSVLSAPVLDSVVHAVLDPA